MCCFCLSVWSISLKSSCQSYGSNSACFAEYSANQLLLIFSFFPLSFNVSGGHLYLKKCSGLFCTQLCFPVCDKDCSMCESKALTLAAEALLCCLYSSALPNLGIFALILVFPCSVFSSVLASLVHLEICLFCICMQTIHEYLNWWFLGNNAFMKRVSAL